MIFNVRRNAISIAILTLLLTAGKQAKAACDIADGGSYVRSDVSFGDVYVQRDTAIGEVVATQTGDIITSGAGSVLYGCSEPWMVNFALGQFSVASPVATGSYNTNLQGIGIRVTDVRRGFVFPYDWQLYAAQYLGNTTLRVELIKTGPAPESGLLNPGAIAYLKGNGEAFAEMQLSGVNRVNVVACTVLTPTLTFAMGDIPRSMFHAQTGPATDVAGNSQTLKLNCDPETKINFTMSGIQNPDVSDDSVLALSSQGSSGIAVGLGVQLLFGGLPLRLNEKVELAPSLGGEVQLPITLRYYQTLPFVTEGQANASATFDITYQ